MPHPTGLMPAFITSFCASAVEFVEAMTVILAVGSVRGWRDAVFGASVGLLLLFVGVALFGPTLTLLPLARIQLVVGALLLLFGMRWLRKATLRAAGVIPLHDEEKAYAETAAAMRQASVGGGLDIVAFSTSLNITLLEGLEVIFIVIALGAESKTALQVCAAGALTALMVVIVAGIAIRGPLSRTPENSLKFVVGALLSAFGTFWVGEGLGFSWPGSDWALPVLAFLFMLTAAKTLILGRICARWRNGQ